MSQDSSRGVRIRVQRGIPIPACRPRGLNGTREPIYPWAKMRVGDSFLFPEHIGRAAHSAASNESRKGERKFVARKTDAGYRCWRIK